MTLALESEILERSTLLTDLHWSLENLCCRENVTWRKDIWTTICQTKHFFKGIIFREFDQIAETFLDLELNKRECQLQGM